MTARTAAADATPQAQSRCAPASDSGAPYQLILSQGLPDEAGAARLRRDLPESEWHWITRLRRPEDRLRSLTGRALARRLLGQRLGLPPEAVPLITGPHGRPMLAMTGADAQRHADSPPGTPAAPPSARHFNIAHSGDLVLVGVGPWPLGVDVEHCPDRVGTDLWRLATGQASTAPDPETFCAQWVRREAALKACGLGLTAEPGTLRLPEPDDAGWAPVAGRPEVDGLWVRLLQAPPNHCAALCLTHAPAPDAWALETLALADWISHFHRL